MTIGTGVGTGMGGEVTVTLLPGWKLHISNEAWRNLRPVARYMEREAKRLVPKRTRTLERSIRARVGRQSGLGTLPVVELTASAPYAMFVEFGTGRAGAGSPAGSGVESDRPSSYQHGPSPGMAAQPYLRPALNRAVRRFYK